VRYTALISGIAYGFLHNRTLYKEAEDKKAKAAIKQRESWIEQAKKEYAQKNASSSATSTLRSLASSATGGLISGPDDGEFQFTCSSSLDGERARPATMPAS
jgi:F-type H+-transporting ATP synthase subunit e